jgi:alkanesulfonate monooxygenase SsuD/methylene tetrahydromethanopterin reductase-like flavin-dependent oxidoreductase (luciferase family)
MTAPAPHTGRPRIGVMLPISEGQMEGGTARWADILAMAQAAEAAGFDSLWLADHLIYRFPGQGESGAWEAFTILAALAAATKRVQIAPLVACTSFREPALLAKIADTMDEVSGGRFILGLGAGWNQPEYTAFGYPYDHLASRFEEALTIIVGMLHGDHVTFEGRYYHVEDAYLRPRGPSERGPRILIGASQPRMLRLVAKHADAWNTAWHTSPEMVSHAWNNMLAACNDVGRERATLELTVGTMAQVLGPGEGTSDQSSNLISGSAEEVARTLMGFGQLGASHLIASIKPRTVAGVERFGEVIRLMDEMASPSLS